MRERVGEPVRARRSRVTRLVVLLITALSSILALTGCVQAAITKQSDGCVPGGLVGSEAQEQAFNFFVQAGLKDYQAAGIIGNMIHESGVEPMRLQSTASGTKTPAAKEENNDDPTTGWGLVQWTPPSKYIRNAHHAGKSFEQIESLEYQLQVVQAEISKPGGMDGVSDPAGSANPPPNYSGPNLWEQLKKAPNSDEATRLFEASFERAGTVALADRQSNAKKVLAKYGGKSAGGGSDSVDTGSDSGGCGATAGKNGWAVTGDNAMAVFYQVKAPWNTAPYGSLGTIGVCGCGPTSTAMVVRTLTGDTSVNPKTMAAFFASHGGQESGCGSTWSLWADGSPLAEKYHLKFTNLGTDMSKVKSYLSNGGFVIMSQGPGMFTSSGHIMVLRGFTDDGKWLVADPAHPENTTKESGFTTQQISAALKGLWAVQKASSQD